MNSDTNVDAKMVGFTTIAAILGVSFALAMSASADLEDGYGNRDTTQGVRDTERHAQIETTPKAGE